MLSELPRTTGQLSTVEKLGGAMIVDGVGEIQMRTREQLMQECLADQGGRGRRRVLAAQSARR